MAQDIIYIEVSIPPELTIAQYRRARPKAPSAWQRFAALVGFGPVTPAVAG